MLERPLDDRGQTRRVGRLEVALGPRREPDAEAEGLVWRALLVQIHGASGMAQLEEASDVQTARTSAQDGDGT
ncbi:hypothetical protein [Nocardioides luteus]|uniref:hypothetical protein n=1 Tax=Nocardioides luteus TaxID=1844 RepID=UPI00210DA841|nr:hypothetical protein [Nocardioides luteus]